MFFCEHSKAEETVKSIDASLNPSRIVEASFSNHNETVICSLSDVPKASKVKFQINLANKSGASLSAASLKASCGCMAGIAKSVSIPKEKTASILGVLDVPNEVGDFEKTITVTDDHDDQIVLKIQGKSVFVVELIKPALVIKSRESDVSKFVVSAVSPLGIDLTKFDWKPIFESDCKVECKRSVSEGKRSLFDLHITISNAGLSDQSVSSVLRLEAAQPDSSIKISEDMLVYLAFNSVTTPRRLALRKIGDSLRGSLIVHSPDFVDDPSTLTSNLRLKIGPKTLPDESTGRRSIVVECIAKKIKTGSYLINIQFDPRELGAYDDFDSWVLTMEEGREWFAVPVLFE